MAIAKIVIDMDELVTTANFNGYFFYIHVFFSMGAVQTSHLQRTF